MIRPSCMPFSIWCQSQIGVASDCLGLTLTILHLLCGGFAAFASLMSTGLPWGSCSMRDRDTKTVHACQSCMPYLVGCKGQVQPALHYGDMICACLESHQSM